MSKYQCPLCKQEVSKALYEKITGIWQDKEKQMANLREKEKSLKAKEQKMLVQFQAEKKRIVNQEKTKFQKLLSTHKKQILKERESFRREREKIDENFRRKLSSETNRIMRNEVSKRKEIERDLRRRFAESAKDAMRKESDKLQREKRLQQNRYDQLNRQFRSLQTKNMKDLEKANQKIKSLEEQVKKNQTPQVLGLLEEKDFLSKLKEMYHNDSFDHTGKGDDIIHHVFYNKAEVGCIVYELKKVSVFNPAHISQAYEAKQKRNADYAVLVTNAKRRKDDFGFSVHSGVIIIHPAGALVLISIIRDHIISISKLKLTGEKRSQAVNAVLEYVQGPAFKNGIESIILDTVELYNRLKKEVKDHISSWENRLDKYRNIHTHANKIGSKVVDILLPESAHKKIVQEKITSIQLPAVIQ
jgi:hypothetical protein